jgi:hypothetical protein
MVRVCSKNRTEVHSGFPLGDLKKRRQEDLDVDRRIMPYYFECKMHIYTFFLC